MAKHRNIRNAKNIRRNMFIQLKNIKPDMLVRYTSNGWYFYMTTDGVLKTDGGWGLEEVVSNVIDHYNGEDEERHNHWLKADKKRTCLVIDRAFIANYKF